MTNEELVIRIQSEENNVGDMLQLYNQVKPFIHSVAWRFKSYEEIEDLEQEGYLALYDAIAGYDPERGYKFLTYAEHWIRQRMMRYIQKSSSCIRIPVHSRERIQQYKRLCEAFQREVGCDPTDSEISHYLALTVEQVTQLKQDALAGVLFSLDAPAGSGEDIDISLMDTIQAPGSLEDAVMEKVQGEQLNAALWDCVDALEGRQSDIVRKKYQDDMTLGDIGQAYGITAEAVRQVHAKALRELRKPHNSKRLRPFLPEEREIYGMAMTGFGLEGFNHTWTSSTERAALIMTTAREAGERRRKEHLEMLNKINKSVAKSQQKVEGKNAENDSDFGGTV